MDIDATRLSRDDRDKRMREGRCFECNEQGHVVRDCPKKKKQGNNNPFRSQWGNNPFRNQQRGASGGSKAAQVRALLKELSPDERKQILDEHRSNPAARIRALIQELPAEEKEAMVEEVSEENFQ